MVTVEVGLVPLTNGAHHRMGPDLIRCQWPLPNSARRCLGGELLGKEGKLKTEKQIKVGWLDGKERRQKEGGETVGADKESKEEIVGRIQNKMRCFSVSSCESLAYLCVCVYTHTHKTSKRI